MIEDKECVRLKTTRNLWMLLHQRRCCFSVAHAGYFLLQWNTSFTSTTAKNSRYLQHRQWCSNFGMEEYTNRHVSLLSLHSPPFRADSWLDKPLQRTFCSFFLSFFLSREEDPRCLSLSAIPKWPRLLKPWLSAAFRKEKYRPFSFQTS